MQERTRNALNDNKIYKSEKKELDKLAEEVNLSDEDILTIESFYKSGKN